LQNRRVEVEQKQCKN